MSADQIRIEESHAGLQRLTARFGGHAYDLHRHETYAVGLTLWGAQSFHYRGALQTSSAGQVMVIHPDEAHDGHAGVDAGFAYRMLYVDPAAISAALGGSAAPFVTEVVADDAASPACCARPSPTSRARSSHSPSMRWWRASPSCWPRAAMHRSGDATPSPIVPPIARYAAPASSW